MIPPALPRKLTEQFLTRSKNNLSKVNFSGFLMSIRHFSRKTTGRKLPLNAQDRTTTQIAGFLPACLQKNVMSSSGLVLDDDPRSEITADLLNLASTSDGENDLPEVFRWMANDMQDFDESPKCRLEKEVGNAGLTFHQPPTPKDGNCLPCNARSINSPWNAVPERHRITLKPGYLSPK